MVLAALNYPLEIGGIRFVVGRPYETTDVENEPILTFSTHVQGSRYDYVNGDYTMMLSHVVGTIGWDPTPRDYSFQDEWDAPDA